MLTAHDSVILIVGEQEPASLVEWAPDDGDHYPFTVVLADMAGVDPDDVPDDALHAACAGCVVERWPDVQTAMAMARLHGTAVLDDDGRWAAA